jgi:hypothetical protein
MVKLAGLTVEVAARAMPVERPQRLLDLGGGRGLHAAGDVRQSGTL